ncbi:MAG: glycosyltransferase family 2 protein [Cyanobacteria bacterium P01_E01_bin.42]
MISVIIPAFNEEEAIVTTLENIKKVLASIESTPTEIIVVDDGSWDRTSQLAQKVGAKVIRNPHNIGYGFSLKTGIKAARFDTIVITDADGTYPLDKIPVLLEEYKKGFDMVIGMRTGRYYRESLFKIPLRIILKWLVEFTTGRKVPDINSGLRIFSKEVVTPYFNNLCNTFSFTTSLTLAYMMTGKFVSYIQIPYYKRVGTTKVRIFRDSIRTLQFIVQAILYYNPLKIFIVLCGLTMVFSLVCLILSFAFHVLSTFILGISSILVTIIIFALGLLADLLRQIMIGIQAKGLTKNER